MPYRCYCVGYRGGREEEVVYTLDAGKSAAAAAGLEFSMRYSSGGTAHARHNRRRLGLRTPGSQGKPETIRLFLLDYN